MLKMKEEDKFYTKELAVFEWQFGLVEGGKHLESDEYVRVSEFVEVKFPKLEPKTIMDAKVKAVDAEIKKTLAQLQVLEDNRASLLALEHLK